MAQYVLQMLLQKTNGYERYGGRGIKVCEEWKHREGFLNFYNWSMENGYNDNLTLDRIDVNGDYKPSNCRWSTKEEQFRNMRSNKIYEYNGKKYTQNELCRKFNINTTTFSDRLKSGMTLEEALTKPVKKSGGHLDYTINCETKLLGEWCNIYGINYHTAWKKIKKGKSIEEALKII